MQFFWVTLHIKGHNALSLTWWYVSWRTEVTRFRQCRPDPHEGIDNSATLPFPDAGWFVVNQGFAVRKHIIPAPEILFREDRPSKNKK
jgi:hypothetical protein